LVDYKSEINVAAPYLNDLRIVINQTAKNEDVSQVKRADRKLKGRVRTIRNTYKLTNDMSEFSLQCL